jgi:hypothetical protein
MRDHKRPGKSEGEGPPEARQNEPRRYHIFFGKNKDGTITPDDITDEMIDLINTLCKMSESDQ